MGSLFYYKDKDLFVHRTVSEHPTEEQFPMHAHDGIEIFYFISGCCRYMVEGNEYILKPHDVLIMRASETHNLRVIDDMPYERAVIHLYPDRFSNYDPEGLLMKPFFDRPLGKLNQYHEEHFASSVYKSCFESIYQDTPLGLKLEIEAKMFTILCEIYKAYVARCESGEEVLENTQVVSQLIEYINDNLYEQLSLNSLGNRFFLSNSQLNRLFRKATGTSIWEYIIIKRLIAARNRIRAGEQAGKVCASCGFKDYSSFYRMYKSRFGVSPKQDDLTGERKKQR